MCWQANLLPNPSTSRPDKPEDTIVLHDTSGHKISPSGRTTQKLNSKCFLSVFFSSFYLINYLITLIYVFNVNNNPMAPAHDPDKPHQQSWNPTWDSSPTSIGILLSKGYIYFIPLLSPQTATSMHILHNKHHTCYPDNQP
jgi:hypothetical protein